MQHLVSIIIPVYNDCNIRTAIESSLKQTYPNIEILIIDDASDIHIKPIIREFSDKRLKYFPQQTHTNANICRNIGIKKAKGKYISFLDSDDLYMKNHIQSCLEILQKEKSDGLYSSSILHSGYSAVQVSATLPEKDESIVNYLIRKGYGACTSSLFMTRKSALDIQWDETLKRHQDYDFIARYSKKYQLTAKKEVGCICCDIQTKKKLIDFDSCIRFAETYKKEIKPGVHYIYLNHMLNLARNTEAKEQIIKYYETELEKIKKHPNNQ